jgi:hypothetical protein
MMSTVDLPEFRDWSLAAVHLLQGVVYADDERTWDLVLSSQSQLVSYFARLGLLLVVDESEELAYLRQLTDDERPEGYDALPRLFRRTRLGWNETLLSVLLREELRRFEDEDLHNERCIVDVEPLFDRWKTLGPAQQDEVRAQRDLASALNKLQDLGFVRKFSDEPETWEVRRILKARLPVAELEDLKARLRSAGERRARDRKASESDG